MKPSELAHAIDHKVPGPTRSTKERNTWVVIDGRKICRVTCPQGHSADLKKGTLEAIRKDLKLTREQFMEFVSCRMTGPQYEAHLRALMTAGLL